MERTLSVRLPFCTLRLKVQTLGRDCHLLLRGGREHLGCCVLAMPRPSLQAHGAPSATCSVLNVTSHKDEELCRRIAHGVAAATGRVTVCAGGVHLDDITPDQIQALCTAADGLVRRTVRLLKSAGE